MCDVKEKGGITHVGTSDSQNVQKIPQNSEKKMNNGIIYPRECEICFKIYKTRQSFSVHKYACGTSVNRPYRLCNSCQRSYKSNASFYNHIRKCKSVESGTKIVHSNIHPIKCEISVDTFSEHNRIENILQCDNSGNYSKDDISNVVNSSKNCEISPLENKLFIAPHIIFIAGDSNSRIVEQVPQISKEKLNNTLYPRECKKCYKIYKTRQSFSAHKYVCGTSGNYIRLCNICQRSYKSNSSFYNHVKRCKSGVENNANIVHKIKQSFSKHKKICDETVNTAHVYPRKCVFCAQTFECKKSFLEHKINCSSTIYDDPTSTSKNGVCNILIKYHRKNTQLCAKK